MTATNRRRSAVIGVIAATLLAAGCDSASSIVDPKGSEAHRIAGVWWLMFGLATAVYVVVAGFIVYAITRGRRTGGRPSRLRDNMFIWVGGVVVPTAILLTLAVVTVDTTSALRAASAGELQVNVTGERWWWRVRYPGDGVVTANEIHVPQGQPVDVRLTSDNVIHSFWVPELAGKEDAIPGQTNDLRFTAEKVGRYLGVCAEFCGLQHGHMGFAVTVDTPADFGRWIARHADVAREPGSDQAATGAVIFQREACAGCHTIRGTSAVGKTGPDLSDVGQRRSLGGEVIENTPENLEAWIHDAPSIKPGVLMPSFHTLSAREVAAIAAYLEAQQ